MFGGRKIHRCVLNLAVSYGWDNHVEMFESIF